MKKIILQNMECQQCAWKWTPRKNEVTICPSCKSSAWDMPKQEVEQNYAKIMKDLETTRVCKGWTQLELAGLLGCRLETVNRWMMGHCKASIPYLAAIKQLIADNPSE